tara:strand:+ start:2597 stop:2941 length:345 start_codon:yes stop_codon:yes gene_type:complete
MSRILHLVLILALTIGVVIAPEDVSAKEPSMAMTQMDGQDLTCDGCPSTNVIGISCDSGCTVPCGLAASSGMIAPEISSTQFSTSFDFMRLGIDLLLPMGTGPALDPFPPKLAI